MAAKFPYKVLNDLSEKLKAAQEEAAIAKAEIQAMQSVNTNPTMYSTSQNTHLDNHQVEELAREKEELEMQNTSLTTKVEDLTKKVSELLLLNTTLSNLSRERDELQQQNTSVIKDLTSRLSNLTEENAALTHDNNRYHLRLATSSCEDQVTPCTASTAAPWSPGCSSTPWSPVPAYTSSPGPATRTPWSPSVSPLPGSSPSPSLSGRSTSPAQPVPLMSLDLSFFSMNENTRMSTMLEPSPANTCVEDEWTNMSTIVPYIAVLDSAPVLQEKQKQDPTMDKRRSKAPFITRLVNSLVKLERKYAIPPHKRKARMFTRRPTQSSIIPKEFTSLYTHLAIPDPEPIVIPEPFPTIAWEKVRFKPSLPSPKPYPVYGCSPDPVFYEGEKKKHLYDSAPIPKFSQPAPFGSLPGYSTNLGVVKVPVTPVGGYVYHPESGWVIHATSPCSSTSGLSEDMRGSTGWREERKKEKKVPRTYQALLPLA